MYAYKKTAFIFFPIFLILLDQLSKYIIRLSGGFYICNANLAFGLKISYAAILIAVLVLAYILYQIGNYKYQIANNKQISNSKSLISKRWFWKLNFGFWKLPACRRGRFDIWDLRFGILLILSGAISNIIDRLAFGCVIDFIDLRFWSASIAMRSIAGWPVFNLADAYITMGAFAVIIRILLDNKAK